MTDKQKAIVQRAKRTMYQVLGGVVVNLPTMSDIDLFAVGRIVIASVLIALAMGACSDLPEVSNESSEK